MKQNKTLITATLAATLMLQGCADNEATQISFCKDSVSVLFDADEQPSFTSQDTQIQRPSHAIIKLGFDARDAEGRTGAMTAQCWYEYDADHEDAASDADDLWSYATLPFKMTVNGQELRPQVLKEVVKVAQGKFARDAMEKASKGFKEATNRVQNELKKAANR